MRTVSHTKGQPLQANGIRIETVTPYLPYGILVRRIIPSLANGFRFYVGIGFNRSPFSRATLLMGSPFIKGFASISKRLLASEATRGILRLPKWSAERETPIQKGSLASPSHHSRLRLQVDSIHNQLQVNLEISKSDVLSLASTLKSRCSSLHIIFVDRRLLHIVSSPDAAPLGPHPATLRGSLSRQA